MKKETQMVLLSYLSYYDFYRKDPVELAKHVQAMLLPLNKELGFSGISWGPVAHKGCEVWSDSLAFIVQNAPREFTLVFRGTNPCSLASWLFQDLNISGQVPWTRQSEHAPSGPACISKATDTSLAIHTGLSSGGTTILEWLLAALGTGEKLQLNITGHSLGGLMSTTFALYLHDELVWAEKASLVDIEVFSFAGPTAGNAAYIAHLDSAASLTYTTYVNSFDVATHVWKEAAMENLPTLYDGITMKGFERALLDQLTSEIRNLGYETPGNPVPVWSKSFPGLADDYLVQAVLQHVLPYLVKAFVDEPLVCMNILLTVLLDALSELVSGMVMLDAKGSPVKAGCSTRRVLGKALVRELRSAGSSLKTS